ncbi:uncharacterized protein LOC120073556 [Benincasa hispida]|uniref:uncharacterized protein LOC120073556 n=1 Tax=Benincasa hispida TaxID=102211 RepID=UPI001900F703|nr:uncharacterized protein LOC120073556 [Benincasa hispida]
MQLQASSIRNLEVQVRQLVTELKNKTPGTLPNSSEAPGSSGKEQCQAVTLRSGRKAIPVPTVPESVERVKEAITNNDHSIMNSRTTSLEATTITQNESSQNPEPKSTLKKKDDSKQFKRFLDVLRQLHINIPLVEALEQMPSYVKFLKDILANKRKIGENETIALTYECSALFQNNIPKKMKDPGSFTLPSQLGGKKSEMRSLAKRSITHPEGKIKDVLVKVDKFIFPTDFIILDYEADTKVPIILGHPFLATGHVLINEEQWHEFQEETEEEDFEVGIMLEESCAAIQTDQDFESIKLSE